MHEKPGLKGFIDSIDSDSGVKKTSSSGKNIRQTPNKSSLEDSSNLEEPQ